MHACRQASQLTNLGLFTDGTGLSTSSTKATAPIVIAANTVISTLSLADANNTAIQMAKSFLTCVFLSDAQCWCCDSTTSTNPPVPCVGTPTTGNRLCNSGAQGLASSTVSHADANTLAKSIITGGLVCSYKNNRPYTYDQCPTNSFLIQPGNVKVGAVTSFASVADANSTASTLAQAQVVCAPNSVYPKAGPPGGDGAQTNCSGSCYGFYS